ncbi:MAG: hypothetical protein LBK47_07700 [Prevotellaceae bacterium]|nr:hypothetical protein [Prevotellaceae bacterium]
MVPHVVNQRAVHIKNHTKLHTTSFPKGKSYKNNANTKKFILQI